jgi:signal transduction histidine kinase
VTARLSEPGQPQPEQAQPDQAQADQAQADQAQADQAPPDQDGPSRIGARARRGVVGRAWSLRRRLAGAFVIAGVLLAIGCVVGGLALNSMIGSLNLQLDRLDPAARQNTYLLASLLDEETGVRGFVITDRADFLEPYRHGLAQTAAYERLLRGLVRPYPALRHDLRTVERQAAKWRIDYAEPAIATAIKHGRVGVPLEAVGKNDFDRLRGNIAALNAGILSERASALLRLHTETTAVIVVAITAAVALIGAAAAAWAALNAWVVRPLGALGEQARIVASGGIDHQLTVSGPQEVRELAADVEAMRQQLLSSMGNLTSKATELERSNRELEQFAYVASHDLQEPLRKIASFCQMLESRYGGQLDERARQYISYAVDGAKRMQLLINELLTFSRVGQPGTSRAPVDLNAVANEAIDRLDATITDTDAHVIVDDLPTVSGDATLLAQLFQNLIANSIKFRRMDEPPVIRISAERRDGFWEFACTDNGIGIAPAHAERVFVIFQRLHPRDAYPGTGIGLALCRKIVEFHGGRIWVDIDVRSQDPKPNTAAKRAGTTIRWTIPWSDRHEEAS